MFKNRKVFISGGNGVIGNCLVKKLHEQGAIIFVGDLKPRPGGWPKEIKYRQGDLNTITKEELEDFEAEFFFHLAATFERSTESYSFWDENFQHNVKLSNHLMSCLKDSSSLKKVVFASSYLIYDPALYQFPKPSSPYMLKETDPIYPRNLTGVAKLLHEIELRFINNFKREQFKIISARIFRGHGLNSKDIISRWVRALINKEDLKVYRKEGMFDYIFSEDSAEGLMRLAISEEAEGIVNLGTGKARKVQDVLEILKTHFPDLHYTEEDEAVDIPYEASQADMTLYKELTGWLPVNTLEMSVGKIVKFELERNTAKEETIVAAHNILITSVSKKIPLITSVRSAVEKLGSGNSKLYGGDMDDTCIGKYFVDVFWKMPRLNDAAIGEIINYCVSNNIKSIIPTRDGELIFWATHKKSLEEKGITVFVSDKEAIENTLDKFLFFEKGSGLKYPVIPTTLELEALTAASFVVKDRYGAGAKSIGLNLSKEDASNHAKNISAAIFQEYISGVEYSVDIYISRSGNFEAAICRSREKVVDGESQVTVTHDDVRIEKLCMDFARDLGLTGHCVFQVLVDKKDQIHIIECNARFGGASSLSVAAGLDTFYWFLLENQGADTSGYFFKKPVTRLKQVRFPQDKIIYGV